jgi:hypothetical protein
MIDKDILEHLLQVNTPKAICTLQEFRHQVVQYNWLFDRELNKVFIDLPIGSHECTLALLQIGHTKVNNIHWIDWIDSFDLNFGPLAEKWLKQNRGAYMTSVNGDVVGKLNAIERRILCQ